MKIYFFSTRLSELCDNALFNKEKKKCCQFRRKKNHIIFELCSINANLTYITTASVLKSSVIFL